MVDRIEGELGFLKQMLIGYIAVIWTNYRTLNCLFSDIIFVSIRKILAKLQSSMSHTSSGNVAKRRCNESNTSEEECKIQWELYSLFIL